MKYSYYHIPKFHSISECKAIYNHCLENINHSIEDFPAVDVVKTSKVKYCYFGNVKDALDKIKHITIDINRQFFGFDLYEKSNFDTANLNEYSDTNQGEYGWHSDGHLDGIWDSKLTVILNLSQDEYEGGDFEIFLNKPIKINEFKESGSLLIFPSFLHHRVTPVTKGHRITLSQWFLGPALR